MQPEHYLSEVDFYSELGVPRTAGTDEIRKAYRKLAAELHPDKNQGKPEVEARFKRVNHAYHTLTDPKKRALYDEFGEEGLREGFNPNVARSYQRRGGRPASVEDLFGGAGGAGIGDLFGDLFGGGARGARKRKSADVESEVTIEFVSAVRGAELELAVGERLVKVRVPPGANDGDKVRVKGGGPAVPGGTPGDLVLTVRVKPHEFFERDGLDLKVDIPISPLESLRGGKVDVPTPTGTVSLRIPAGAQSGQLLRLREKGVTRGGKTGDLFVRFLVRMPKTTTPELEVMAEKLSAAVDLSDRASIKF